MTSSQYMEKLERLEKILNEQVTLVDNNDYRTIEKQIADCDQLIDQLRKSTVPDDTDCIKKSREVMELYRLLILMLDAGKSRVASQLKNLRKK